MRTFFFEQSPVIDKGYWRKPLDPTIAMTSKGQFFNYFDQHIHPRYLTESEGSFHRYAELPAELQLRVIQQCDAPTLFRLMHTTRDLRTESEKLFFSDQTTWYRLDAEPFLRHCLPTESIYDICFLASIEQLDLHCPHFTMGTWLPEGAGEESASKEERFKFFEEHINANIKDFWCTVQRFCPHVKRVMLSTDGGSIYEKHVVTNCYRKMAQLCPQGLDVFFYASEPAEETLGRRRKRVLWRLRTGDRDVATEISPKREEHLKAPGLIVIPPEKAYRGRVGHFLRSHAICDRYNGQRRAAEFYRAAAIEKYYFEGRHEPFGCSDTDCDVWFEHPEQYTTHLLATEHGKSDTAHGQVEALVTENTNRLQ